MNSGIKCCLDLLECLDLFRHGNNKVGIGLCKEHALAYRILLTQFLYLTCNKTSTGGFGFVQRMMIEEWYGLESILNRWGFFTFSQ